MAGGDKFLREIDKRMASMKNPITLRVGFLENATYPDGTSVASVAFWNEFGTKRIPPRPFFRNMIQQNKDRWPRSAAIMLKASNYDAKRMVEMMGTLIKEQLQKSIYANTPPPNAPSTVERKGHSRTLIDTGYMVSRVDYDWTYASQQPMTIGGTEARIPKKALPIWKLF